MSKIKLLLDVVSDLRSLADSIQAVAEVLTDKEPVESTQPEAPAPTNEAKVRTKAVTLEQVRNVEVAFVASSRRETTCSSLLLILWSMRYA